MLMNVINITKEQQLYVYNIGKYAVSVTSYFIQLHYTGFAFTDGTFCLNYLNEIYANADLP